MQEYTPISPETRPVAVPERISSERVSLTTRVLLGPQALLAHEPMITAIAPDTLCNLTQSMYMFEETSRSESTAFWADKAEMAHNEQKKLWSTQMQKALTHTITQADERENDQWKRVYENCGIDTTVTPESVDALYDTYFTGTKREKNLTRFIQTILESYTEDSGLDHAKLQQDMGKITWVASMFGEQTSKSIPSLIEATIAERNPTIAEELIAKATAQENGQMRINRLSASEVGILNHLRQDTRTPLPEESAPRRQKAGIVIPNEQLTAIHMKKAKLPSQGTEMYFLTIAQNLIDLTTGKVKETQLNLLPEHQRFLRDVQQTYGSELVASMRENKGTLMLSPVAWSMLDAIASHSHALNKELGFTIQGVSEINTASGNELFIATHIVPAHDYATAQTHVTDMRDTAIYEKNAEALATQTGLADFFALEAERTQTKEMKQGEVLFTVHTHQEQLGSTFIATPSPEDEKEVRKILRNPEVTEYTWGIVTKTSEGDLHLALFLSQRDAQGKVHHQQVAIASPDLKTIQTMPEHAFGEAIKKKTPLSFPSNLGAQAA